MLREQCHLMVRLAARMKRIGTMATVLYLRKSTMPVICLFRCMKKTGTATELLSTRSRSLLNLEIVTYIQAWAISI